MCIKASNTQKILVNELVALCVARDCAKSNEIRIWESDGRACRRLHVTALYGNSLCALTIPNTTGMPEFPREGRAHGNIRDVLPISRILCY